MPRRSSPYGHPWPRVRLEILRRDGYACRVGGPTCKGRATTVDHIVPLSRGGARLDPSNLRAACASCQTWCASKTRELMADAAARWCPWHQQPFTTCAHYPNQWSQRWY